MRTAAPALMVVDDDLHTELTGLLTGLTTGLLDGPSPGPRVMRFDDLVAHGSADDPHRAAPAELALLQFTSGSSGTARGVRVPHAALESNVEAIRRWLRMAPGDRTASWLPVHHDMGLIGCLVTPVVSGTDVLLMRPEQFIREPLRFRAASAPPARSSPRCPTSGSPTSCGGSRRSSCTAWTSPPGGP